MFHHGLGPLGLIGAILVIIPFWRILPRLGYNSWMSLLLVIPLVNIIFLYIVAFSGTPTQSPGGTAPAAT
ncbi:MAG TPA: hypothetical protein VK695_03825 [Steroidobacteraceae bacterium]|jgi:hypothetical protein|nr:hypothetical protein [Steroidobacteraceae bacterium]